MSYLRCGKHTLDLSRPIIMGILNVTPDSFSDGGQFLDPQHALDHAQAMVEQGADIIDIGGESTRPGAQAVTVAEELRRVIPLLEALAPRLPVPISVDTSKPEVMHAAADAGAGLLNDVYALRQPGALAAAAASGLPVCLMHMQGEPRSMQDNPWYQDVVAEVKAFLLERAAAAEAAGVRRDSILLDPGFGFGKTLAHNIALLQNLSALAATGYPLLAGLSRKRMIGALLGNAPVEQRLHGSVAAALLAIRQGAAIVRVHDVQATRDALTVWQAVANNSHHDGGLDG